MSQCPFAQGAEAKLIKHLREAQSTGDAPRLEVRDLFQKRPDKGKTGWTSLHGDEEVDENLRQMVIRDTFPDRFHDYLLARAESKTAWAKLAVEAGLSLSDIETIRQKTIADREALIQAEYAYLSERYGSIDASPTFIWESQRVGDLSQVPVFKEVDRPTEQCGQK